MTNLPTFADLCDSHRRATLGLYGPKGTAWGLWGQEDNFGTLNLLTEETVKKASTGIRHGRLFSLNLPVDAPKPTLFKRKTVQHQIISFKDDIVFDDQYDHFNPQSSTQWDGLRHAGFVSENKFYGGIESKEFLPGPDATGRLGIHHMAQRGIAGRAVLLDYGRWADIHKPEFDALKRNDITVAELDQVAAYQDVTFEQGDILLIRVGWTKAFETNQHQIEQLVDVDNPASSGVKACEETYRWFWDHHFSAVISDNPSFEAYPIRELADSCHAYFLGGWGMPIGELAYLEKLADDSAEDKVYESFFTSAPIHKEGGVSSPINGLCIK
ncbi:hypothetical protein EC973_002977 [Apophysomyces ossiformis]|uniref:Cyclase n=1 Tax=Apophysomyces ossiformis TaxID=679940 RepID=A0A8H7ELC7_9FUNG|nr:hypothetical protein EC973_002977 [Apophysomyces ossiformis]